MIEPIYEHTLEEPTILIKYKMDDKEYFEDEPALAVLLLESVVFLNSHWWMSVNRSPKFYKDPPENPWPEDACKTFSVSVNCNDIFCWGAADAEECYLEDLEDLYDHWQKDHTWGAAIWCIKRRGMMPQKPVEEAIRKEGIWDLDSMNIEENPVEKYYQEQREKETQSNT